VSLHYLVKHLATALHTVVANGSVSAPPCVQVCGTRAAHAPCIQVCGTCAAPAPSIQVCGTRAAHAPCIQVCGTPVAPAPCIQVCGTRAVPAPCIQVCGTPVAPALITSRSLQPASCSHNKKLSYCSATAQRAMSVEILSTASQLYEKSHVKRRTIGNDLEGHSM